LETKHFQKVQQNYEHSDCFDSLLMGDYKQSLQIYTTDLLFEKTMAFHWERKGVDLFKYCNDPGQAEQQREAKST
jgi:hypothetical protein